MWTGAEGLGETTSLGIQPWTSLYRDPSGINGNGPCCHSWRISKCGSSGLTTQHKNPAWSPQSHTLCGVYLFLIHVTPRMGTERWGAVKVEMWTRESLPQDRAGVRQMARDLLVAYASFLPPCETQRSPDRGCLKSSTEEGVPSVHTQSMPEFPVRLLGACLGFRIWKRTSDTFSLIFRSWVGPWMGLSCWTS